jgi:PhnB protein
MEDAAMAQPNQIVTPYLCCRDAARALAFYVEAFGAREVVRYTEKGGGRIGHAEIEVGGALIMVSDEYPEMGILSPEKYGGTPVALRLVVPDVDRVADRAGKAGATIERPPTDEPYGDRSCWVRDPFGHRWGLATPVEEVSKEEIRRRVGDSFLID